MRDTPHDIKIVAEQLAAKYDAGLESEIVDALMAERLRCAEIAKADMKMAERNMNNCPPTDHIGRFVSAGSAAAGRRIAASILGVDQFDTD